ncbi:hypothetical protein GEMRC1_002740 [Eukaryota sp. GEM-RC1]
MFYQAAFKYNLNLPPQALTKKLHETLENRLREAIEGKVYSTYGYVLLLLSLDNIGQGRVIPGTGDVVYPVNFKALVFKPFKNEVLDAGVTVVNDNGVYVLAGPVSLFIGKRSLPPGFVYDPSTSPPAFVSAESGTRIQQGSELRLRILNTIFSSRNGVVHFNAVGTANQNGLGLLQ